MPNGGWDTVANRFNLKYPGTNYKFSQIRDRQRTVLTMREREEVREERDAQDAKDSESI